MRLSHVFADEGFKVTVYAEENDRIEKVAEIVGGYDEGGEPKVDIDYKNGYDYIITKHNLVNDYVQNLVVEIHTNLS